MIDFKIEKTLNKNNSLFKCRNKSNNKLYIGEKIPDIDSYYLSVVEKIKELNIKQFSLPEFITKEDVNYALTPIDDGYLLSDIIKKPFKYANLNTRFIVSVFAKIYQLLSVLHSNNILHTDLKPHNIFIKNHKNGKPNYSDAENIYILGFNRSIEYPITHPVSYTLGYSPPEQIMHITELINQSIDVFACSVSFLEVLTTVRILYDCDFKFMKNLQLSFPIEKPKKVSDELFNIISPTIVKTRLRKPPSYFSKQELVDIFKEAVDSRNTDAKQVASELSDYLKKNLLTKENKFVSFMKRIIRGE